MFCSECGKTIDDESLICPECGAITKNGVLKLQEAAKQGEKVSDNQDFTTLKPKDDTRILRLVAMILGLCGSVSLLSSLLGEFCSATIPIIGKYQVSITNYLDKMTILVVLLAGFSIVASLLKYYILQIVTGSITGAWIAYMIWDIQNRATKSEVSGLLDINFGIGTYLFILAACFILASGIIYAVAAKKSKASVPVEEKTQPKNRKAEIIVSICLGVLVICGIGVFIFLKSFQGTKEAKAVVGDFMNAAIHYDVASMKNYLASDVNDKNGLMEAYTPDIMSASFVRPYGTYLAKLNEEEKKSITDTSILFGKNYLKKYDVGTVTKNEDGSFTIKVSATIIDMSTTDKQIQKKSADMVNEFINKYRDMIQYEDLLIIYGSEEEVAKFIARVKFIDICKIISDAIKDAGSMETEFTFVVKNIDGNYKITEIDYKDE